MIASIAFRNFKALRQASVSLEPFNLVIGPNGSGKSSLIEALMQLRVLARLPLADTQRDDVEANRDGPEVSFRFYPPFDGWEVVLACTHETRCDLLQAIPLSTGQGLDRWDELKTRLCSARRYELDHSAIARPAVLKPDKELSSNGGNLASLVNYWREQSPVAFAGWREDVLRVFSEYQEVSWLDRGEGTVCLGLQLQGEDRIVPAEDLSQGTLYALALFALSRDPDPAYSTCIEELDRGLHPRLLREVRDALYRLSHPSASGLVREPGQVIVTTHSPYLLDLFRDHPEEIILSEKEGTKAHFLRLADRPDLKELMEGATLGDLWFSGLLGGVPRDME